MSNNTPTTSNELVKYEEKMQSAVTAAKNNFPMIIEKVGKATVVLSQIKQITNDEEDAYAKDMLVKSKLTYDLVTGLRKEITSPLDEISALAIEPEKKISNLASHKDSEYNRVKGLRDKYANDKAAKIAADNKRIQQEKDEKQELVNMKAAYENKAFEIITDAVAAIEISIAEFFEKITLENYDSFSGKLNVKPKLKETQYQKIFDIKYDKTKVSNEAAETLLKTVKEKYTFDHINGLYLQEADPIVKKWVDKLPDLKKRLQEVEDTKKTNPELAEQLNNEIQADAQAAKTNIAENAKEAKAAKASEINSAASEEKLSAEFEAQVETQNLDEVSGVRKTNYAVITSPPAKIVETLAKVLFACFMNPKFEGHIEKDEKGQPVIGEDGVPKYTPWAKKILDFYATNCSTTSVPGVEIKQKISTVQKK